MPAVTGFGAVGVFLFGVIVTSGVWGSRRAWLLGVVFPLLGVTALFGWLASRAATQEAAKSNLRTASLVALGLSAIPFAFALLLLTVYAIFFVRDEVSHLFH